MTLERETISLSDQGDDDVSNLLVALLEQASNALVKKLSNNDRDWAQFSNKHQAGVYIPEAARRRFFPAAIDQGARLRRRGDPGNVLHDRVATGWRNTKDAARKLHEQGRGNTHDRRSESSIRGPFASFIPCDGKVRRGRAGDLSLSHSGFSLGCRRDAC